MKILAIGAHFDDVELGCGGSLLKWKAQGHRIAVFVATRSGYRDAKGRVVRTDRVARSEGVKAAKVLGARLYEGGFPTFEIKFAEPLNHKILAVLGEVNPDLVLTHWTGDTHHDHRELARATLHCCRHVRRVLLYRSNWYESGTRFKPRFYLDISSTLEKKIRLIRLHKSEFSRTRGDWEKFVRAEASLAGLKAGCDYAERFEALKWLER